MTTPAVTVIIPVYNGTNYLPDAIESVFAQTFTDYEVVVVDDGSTDGTWELIQSYGSRVRGLRKSNGGVATALNLGIANARGRRVAWLSHDDLFLPSKLEKQVAFLAAAPRFSGCYTDYHVADSAARIIRDVETPWYPRVRAMRALFRRSYIGGSTILIDRACFDAVGGFSETLRYTQDTEMWLRVLSRFELGRVPEKLILERAHPAQGRHNVDPMTAETQAMYARFFEQQGVAGLFPEWSASGDDRRAQARAYCWFGDTVAAHRRWFAFADEQYRRSLSLWPSWRNPARWRLAAGAKRAFVPLRLWSTIRGP